ncbi:MAG: hypothetical protein A2015_00610 [Spirochaetes bacterium GWF1_31_7]|nr:MAG: hypothetical protein A2Y30_03900 [Spirochaetes bacterium GWE1_32_154]OHD45175.1 MAG: hypothetical protein A2Y29_16000 [Spirochaetes bacterium GWE2_31_10]OHD51084.1 MAG: hypothetical protein A2015_00610 [Spirochaetes bacterium GWF1_31_7]HBD94808.1 hypothetical protein [Spirochaetia bacterium]HBI37839.1 hypothetical protein [Spirochaetia bacterium]
MVFLKKLNIIAGMKTILKIIPVLLIIISCQSTLNEVYDIKALPGAHYIMYSNQTFYLISGNKVINSKKIPRVEEILKTSGYFYRKNNALFQMDENLNSQFICKGFFRDTFNGKELILNGKKLTVIENQQKSTIKLPRLYTKVYFVDETTVILSDNSKIDLYRFDGQIQLVYTLENVTDYDIDHDNRVIYYLKSNKELMLFDINLQKNELLDTFPVDQNSLQLSENSDKIVLNSDLIITLFTISSKNILMGNEPNDCAYYDDYSNSIIFLNKNNVTFFQLNSESDNKKTIQLY